MLLHISLSEVSPKDPPPQILDFGVLLSQIEMSTSWNFTEQKNMSIIHTARHSTGRIELRTFKSQTSRNVPKYFLAHILRINDSCPNIFQNILGKCEIWWENKFSARLWECSQPNRTTRCFWGNCSRVRRISANLSTPD